MSQRAPARGNNQPKPWAPPQEPWRLMRAEMAVQSVPIDFRRGIDESQEATMLPAGFALTIRNWVPEPVGGLRSRWAWIDHPHNNREPSNGPSGDGDNHSKPYPVTSRKCRGIHYVNLTDGPGDANGGIWWAVPLYNPDATPANIAQLWVSRSNLTQGWYHIQDFPGTGDIDNYPVAVQVVARKKADGGAAMLYVHPDMQRLNYWTGDIPATANSIVDTDRTNAKTQARPGRALGYHKGRVLMGGSSPSLDNVTYRMYFSDLDVDGFPDFTKWPDKNFVDIGKEDGEPIQCIQSFQGAALVGKPSGVFIFTGTDLTTFAATKIDGTGVAKGHSIVPTPTGALFLGDDAAWFWAGGDPQRISGPVQNTYRAAQGYPRYGAYCGGKVFITSFNPNVPTMSFDLASGAWTTEDTGTTGEASMGVAHFNDRMMSCPYASTLTAPAYYRDVPTGARGKDPWTTISATYTARSPDQWLTNDRSPVQIQQLWIRTRRRGGVGANVPKITVYLDGVSTASYDLNVGDADGEVAVTRRSFNGKTAHAIGFALTHTPHQAGGSTFDIEEALCDIQVEQWRGVNPGPIT